MDNIDAVNNISPVKPTVEIPSVNPTKMAVPKEEQSSFKDILTNAVSEVQKLQDEADMTIKKLVAGEVKDVSEVMVAVQRADTAFQTLMAVRNKVITAYEEIMRMQI